MVLKIPHPELINHPQNINVNRNSNCLIQYPLTSLLKNKIFLKCVTFHYGNPFRGTVVTD